MADTLWGVCRHGFIERWERAMDNSDCINIDDVIPDLTCRTGDAQLDMMVRARRMEKAGTPFTLELSGRDFEMLMSVLDSSAGGKHPDVSEAEWSLRLLTLMGRMVGVIAD